MLLLRPLYFALAATMTSTGALDQALALVLVLIGGKALLEASGVEVPLSSRTHNYPSPNAARSHTHAPAPGAAPASRPASLRASDRASHAARPGVP